MTSPILAPAPGEVGTADPLKIVHVLAPAPFGGLERVVQALAAGQARRGHQVSILAGVPPGDEAHPFVTSARRGGLDVHAVTVGDRAYLAERAIVRDFCRSRGIDILHTHGYRPDVLDSPAAASLGIPRVSTLHGFTGGGWKNRLYERLQLRALRRFDAVIAVARSQLTRILAAGVSRDRVHVLPNAWEARPLLDADAARDRLNVPRSELHLGWVGRLSREKGADVLLDAIALLKDLPVTVSFVGDGREAAALREQAERLGVSRRVRWQGALPDAGRYFPGFDAFVLSSRTEGTPIVLFEAMAAATPIVATTVGGVPDIVSEEEAFLVPSEDPAALASAIRSVHADPDGAAARAQRARRRLSREFSMTSWLDRHDDLYRSLVQPRVRRR